MVSISASVAVYAQILLGALVRHTNSGRACNDDYLLCRGELWPSWGPAQLHMIHRFSAVAVGVIAVAAAWFVARQARREGNRLAGWASASVPVLLVSQIVLGALTVTSGIGVTEITAHLLVGVLLLSSLLVGHLALRYPMRLPAPTPATHAPGEATP